MRQERKNNIDIISILYSVAIVVLYQQNVMTMGDMNIEIILV